MLDKRRPHFLLQGRASRKQKEEEEEEEDDAELQCKRETRHALQGECRRKDGRGRGRCSPPPLIKKRDRRREIRRVSRTTFAATDANDATTDADGHATSPPSFRASRPPFLPLFLFSLLPSSLSLSALDKRSKLRARRGKTLAMSLARTGTAPTETDERWGERRGRRRTRNKKIVVGSGSGE